MMCAIFSATLPLTPVSISSKMMVGSLTAPLIIAFNDSMTRAISPPEATCDTGNKGELVLALNKKETPSCPLFPNGFWVISTLKRMLGMPRGTKRLNISFSIVLAAFCLIVVSWLAFFVQSLSSWSTCACCFCSSSSLWSICSSCFFINFCWVSNSVTDSTWNLCSNALIKSIRSWSFASCWGSKSMFSVLFWISFSISFSSI